MTQSELRLEILKLTYTHARTHEEAVERARFLEKYILEQESVEKSDAGGETQKGDKNSEVSSSKDKRQNKKSGNLESLL